MSEFLKIPILYSKRHRPYAASEPRITASAEELTEVIALFTNLFRNSSLTVEISKIVSGDKPRERKPIHFGMKSIHGIKCP